MPTGPAALAFGGGLVSSGLPTVRMCFTNAVRVGDLAMCAGFPAPSPDTVVTGSPTVFVGFLPAARVGDVTTRGMVIMPVIPPTVIIGDSGSGGAGAPGVSASAIDVVEAESPVGPAGAAGASGGGPAATPMSPEKKKAIVDLLKASGQADDIVKGIEDGRIEMMELNDAARKALHEGPDTVAVKKGNQIFINPKAPNAVAAASTAHEGTHVLDSSENKTPADTLRRELKAFNKQADVWDALKKKDPSLADPQNDTVVAARKSGQLERAVKRAYRIP